MNLQELKLSAKDGYELALRIYEADEPKAVVKFIHGMEEYQDRYQPFAEYLQAAGYTVVTADLFQGKQRGLEGAGRCLCNGQGKGCRRVQLPGG